MTGISLVSHGWICPVRSVTIVNRYILPLNLSLEDITNLKLTLQTEDSLSLDMILSTLLNLQIEERKMNLNIQDTNRLNLNLKTCED